MRAAVAAATALFLVYLLTLAPTVTFWDAGEFVAAAHGFGIPHPPGTPLWVIAAATMVRLLPVRAPLATNLLSALCTAAAGGVSALLVSRWLRSTAAGIAAALGAGAMTAVWSSATETEVYGASLLVACLLLLAADHAGRDDPHAARWRLLLAYLLGLAAALHVSALVAVPAAALLAASQARVRDDGAASPVALDPRAFVLAAGLALVAAGLGTANPLFLLLGLAAAVAAGRRRALLPLALLLLGASGLLVLLLRARHDPALNQGDPSSWNALVDVVARRQYAVPPPLPRRAPWWIQLGNVFEYADWQVALGLAPRVEPSPLRTLATLAWAALGVAGAAAHRRADGRGFRALLLLLACGTVGVALYLNLRAGPSFGWGVLPDDAPREPRERDYFFALGFWVWGLWAGVGAVSLARRWLPRLAPPRAAAIGVAVASLPVVLNWRTMDRQAEPEATLARRVALEILGSAPPNAVLLLGADNDTYPVWYAREAERVRPDVTPVTIPLLGATWYREEQRRRWGLVSPDVAAEWRGVGPTVADLVAQARRLGRPIAASAFVSAEDRGAAVPGGWRRRGLVFVPDDGDPVRAAVDLALTTRLAQVHAEALRAPPAPAIDPVHDYALALLCAVDSAAARANSAGAMRLAPACNHK